MAGSVGVVGISLLNRMERVAGARAGAAEGTNTDADAEAEVDEVLRADTGV